jgi:hypothetical protein
MFIQDNLRELKTTVIDNFPRFKFPLMFSAVVVVPLVVFALAGRDPNVLGQPSLVWSFLAITMLLLISLVSGLMRFRSKSYIAKGLSISSGSQRYR